MISRLSIVLLIATVSCAVLLVTSRHQARKLFNELELEQDKARLLDVEWGQLQLEQSTWATPSRVEKFARERLRMSAPDPRRSMVVPLASIAVPGQDSAADAGAQTRKNSEQPVQAAGGARP